MCSSSSYYSMDNEDVKMESETEKDPYTENELRSFNSKKNHRSFYTVNHFSRVVRSNGKYGIRCIICNLVLCNSSKARLIAHRLKCKELLAASDTINMVSDSKKIAERLQFDKFKTGTNYYMCKCRICNIILRNTCKSRLISHRRKCLLSGNLLSEDARIILAGANIDVSESGPSEVAIKPKNNYSELGFLKFRRENGSIALKCLTCQKEFCNTSKTRMQEHRKKCSKNAETQLEFEKRCGQKTNQYDEYGFKKIILENGAMILECLTCNLILRNTSRGRMRSHRQKCGYTVNEEVFDDTLVTDLDPEITNECIVDTSIVKEEISIMDEPEEECDPLPTNDFRFAWPKVQGTPPNRSCGNAIQDIKNKYVKIPFVSLERIKISKLANRDLPRKPPQEPVESAIIDQAVEPLAEPNELRVNQTKLDLLLAKFIGHCNLPTDIIDSEHFRSFVQELNPDYRIPSQNTLLKHLIANRIPPKNGLLQHDQQQAGNNDKEENCERYNYRVNCNLTKEKYENGKLSESYLWHTLCSSQTKNALVGDLFEENRETIEQLIAFANGMDFDEHRTRIEKSGSELLRFEKCNFCTYRCVLQYLIEYSSSMEKSNLPFVTEKDRRKAINLLKICDSVSTLIARSQDNNFTVADLTQQLLGLKEAADPNDGVGRFIAESTDGLMNAAVCANYLHPLYRGALLSDQQSAAVHNHLLEELDASGLDSLVQFNENSGIFGKLAQKNIRSVDTFWYFVRGEHGNLHDLAIKMLRIPAYSILERLFMDYSLKRNHCS